MRALLILLVTSLATSAFGQTFDLVDDAGRLAGTIEISPGRLVVIEADGQVITFARESRYDSRDGRYLGYFHFQLQRVLRFPRGGRGVMQYADLDAAVPRFRESIRQVRPAQIVPRLNPRPLPGAQSWGLRAPGYAPIDPSFGYGLPGGAFLPGGVSQLAPQSVLIDSKTIPNPGLKPVKVLMLNGGRRELMVTIVDLVTNKPTQHRIAPGRAIEFVANRDAGATRIQTFRTTALNGDMITKKQEQSLPAKVLYEVIVHEWRMQSIAIDRTGKSPSLIEDVNFRGKGLGRFPLPPGNALVDGTIDVDRQARAFGNAGGVAPITAREKDPVSGDPLEDMIRRLQRGD